jgi:DNA-binding NtrC family response regulator
MNSQIFCRSWFGKGSIFSFSLPMAESLEKVASPNTIVDSVGSLPDGLFVVVIDDQIDIQDSMRQLLELAGAEVVTAGDSHEAIEKLGGYDRSPDFIISDYRLQFELGFEVIEAVREEFNHDIPALIITDETSQSAIEIINESGFKVLFKPLSSAELLRAIRQELVRDVF